MFMFIFIPSGHHSSFRIGTYIYTPGPDALCLVLIMYVKTASKDLVCGSSESKVEVCKCVQVSTAFCIAVKCLG